MKRSSARLGLFPLLLLLGCELGKKPHYPQSLVRDQVTSQAANVQKCFQLVLKSEPHLEGRLLLEWDILPDGQVGEITVKQPLSEKLDRCVTNIVADLKFPKPPRSKAVVVVYPFQFKKKKSDTP